MTPKVILLCGKLCAGKTTYACALVPRLGVSGGSGAVILSVDEIMLALFGQHLGDDHDRVAALTRNYLMRKSLEILDSGISVILDWGFWTRADRTATRAFYESRGIACELHYIEVSEDRWAANVALRNALVEADPTTAYYVDENLVKKLEGRFEVPEQDEVDVKCISGITFHCAQKPTPSNA